MKFIYKYGYFPFGDGRGEVKEYTAETLEDCKRVEDIFRKEPDTYKLITVIPYRD